MTVIATLGQWLASLTVTGRLYERNPDGSLPTVLDGVFFQVENNEGAITLPLVEGPRGPVGPDGIPLRPRASVATEANLPAGLNSTTDLNATVLVRSDKTIRVWAGSTLGWINWGSIAGPEGPASSIELASDFTGPTGSDKAFLYKSGTKWTAKVPPEIGVEHNSSAGVLHDQFTVTAIPMALTDRSQGDPGTVPFVSNSTRIVCPTPGLYMVEGRVTFPSNGTGARVCAVRRNGTGATAPLAGAADLWLGDACAASNNIQTSVSVSAEVQLAANGWVELMAGHTAGSGVTLNLTNGRRENRLSLRYLHA